MMVVSPLIYGGIHDKSLSLRGGYLWPEVYLICCCAVAMILCVFVIYEDY